MCAMLKVVLHEKHWKSLNRGLQLSHRLRSTYIVVLLPQSLSCLYSVRNTPYTGREHTLAENQNAAELVASIYVILGLKVP
jgi:hypothetical protein